jgi:hypothetical protein
MTGSGGFARFGGLIFEIGGSTDLILVSLPDDSERFDRVSPMSETVSGRAGGASGIGSATGAGGGTTAAGCFALLIGGTADLREVLASVCGFFLVGEIRSVACCGGVAIFSAGGSALGFAFWEGSFLLLARVAMNLSL